MSKMNLKDLKVQSFVTTQNNQNLKGGVDENPTKLTLCFVCPPSQPNLCGASYYEAC